MVETKFLGGHIIETKAQERNGVSVGIVAGHIAAWSPDVGGIFGMPDKFHPGAFVDSINEHKARGNRPIRLRDMHGRTIGGFPIDTVHEDAVGLYGEGEINLEVNQGREAYALARQRVLTDFSIGFKAVDDRIEGGLRNIYKAIVWEGSIVDEPLNQDARITEVKAVVPFQDLPLAGRLQPWNPNAASDRVREFTSSQETPTEEYKNSFVWFDEERKERFEAYMMPIADVIDDTLVAIPRAIYAAAKGLKEHSIGLADDERKAAIEHLERYYAKMGLVSPFTDDEKRFYTVDEVKTFDVRALEEALISTGSFSKKAASLLAGRMKGEPGIDYSNVLTTLRRINV